MSKLIGMVATAALWPTIYLDAPLVARPLEVTIAVVPLLLAEIDLNHVRAQARFVLAILIRVWRSR